MHEKRTLAIDVGGTKFSIAVFDGNRMVRRESRRTDAEGGRDWMLDQISTIARGWQQEMPADRCGIGFGGPVIFTEQRVALSTHVGGWRDFRLTDWVRDLLGVPAIMDNDASSVKVSSLVAWKRHAEDCGCRKVLAGHRVERAGWPDILPHQGLRVSPLRWSQYPLGSRFSHVGLHAR